MYLVEYSVEHERLNFSSSENDQKETKTDENMEIIHLRTSE